MNSKLNNAIFDKLKAAYPTAHCELNFKTPFELLVAVILSAQCTDARVNKVAEVLFQKYNTPYDFAALTLDELKPYIYSCGYYNNKGKNIIAMSKCLCEKYGGEVPRDFDALTSLAGVGRKTASVVMVVAFGEPAMPVDTHVFRVSGRLGLSGGKDAFQVEKDLKDGFPREQWNELHHLLIFHGRYTCHSQNPTCETCAVREECTYKK